VGNKGFLPVEKDWKNLRTKEVATQGKAILRVSEDSPCMVLIMESDNDADAIRLFHRLYDALGRMQPIHFDVCADDHCQRYQGITRAFTEIVRQAVATTRGQVLLFEGKICDARFSKCCGGAFEEFQYCWENIPHPYLSKQRDSQSIIELPDLRTEIEAEKWIRTAPEAFCHTTDKHILSQFLNRYDQEAIDFTAGKWSMSKKNFPNLFSLVRVSILGLFGI
jgi:SpoIID/LytB domain protein